MANLPRLKHRNRVLVAGLIVGLLRGIWHYPPFSASVSQADRLHTAVYMSILLFSFLPAYLVLMVWIYDQTQSLLVVMLVHALISASQLILIQPRSLVPIECSTT
jgi:membrane protease YdiL (CAAX protease family)